MRYSTIVFDLDGTLLDTLEDLADAVNTILIRHRCPPRSLEEVRGFVGDGLKNLMRRALPEQFSQTVSDLCAEELRTYYIAHSRVKTRPYDGILPLLRDLKDAGVKVAVVSNKADEAVDRLCKYYFPGLVDAAVGETPDRRRKPDPDTVNLALERMGATGAGAVYVGDSEVDAATARTAGMPFVAVTWGFRDRADLVKAGAELLADSVEELAALLR